MVRTSSTMLSLVVLLTVTLAMIVGSAAPANAELVHQYTFNTNANDSVGHLDGTLENGATISGGAVYFTGSGGYVDLGVTDISTMSAVTIETWGTYAASNSAIARIYEFESSNLGDHYADGTVSFAEMVRTTPKFDETYLAYTANTGSPVCLAEVIDATSVTVYINGVSQGTMTHPYCQLSQLNGIGVLGRSPFGGGDLTGSTDEFRIYNTALSASAVLADYNAGPAPVPEPGTCVLLLTGLIGLLCYAWKKRR
jgi:hypothetical protein